MSRGSRKEGCYREAVWVVVQGRGVSRGRVSRGKVSRGKVSRGKQARKQAERG
jgi:hypothetical protein